MASLHPFRLFVDDSGEKEYGPATGRYFVYAGVVAKAVDEIRINNEINHLKISTFGTEKVEIKSNWLRRPQEQLRRYLRPYGITAADLTAFTDDLYSWIASSPVHLVAVAVDKVQMQSRYKKPWYPSATAYQFLLQRYEMHLCAECAPSKDHPRTNCPVIGHVTIDDMDGATPATNQWRDLLRTHHTALKKRGCQLTQLRFDHVANILRFADSASLNMLQIADLAAYNVMRQFRDYGTNWDDPTANRLPTYPYLRRMLGKFMRNSNGVFAGWGIVKWPADEKKTWCLDVK